MNETVVSARTLVHGSRLGRYRVAHRLGVGGMAEVYLAVADGPGGFEKRVALKLVHAHAADDLDRVADLKREARVAATLEHPNIVQVLDVGREDGEFFVAMEYVHGCDVRALLVQEKRGRAFPLDCAIQVVAEAARGLAYAHGRRAPDGRPLHLVHRDISPSNVMVSWDGAVKVADFGLVKVDTSSVDTHSGVLKGKFGYMSPEQSRGEAVDQRSDIHALGILLYELSLGRRAFSGLNAFEIMNKVLRGEFVPPREADPAYPKALEAVVLKAMALDRSDRYSTAHDFEAALREVAAVEDLRPSAAGLAALMRERLGAPEDAQIVFADEPSREAPTVVGGHVELLEPRPTATPRRGVLLATLGVALAAGVGGWWLGAGSAEERTSIESSRSIVPQPSRPAKVEAPPDEPPVEVQVEDPGPEPVTAEPSEPERKPTRRRKAARRRGSGRKGSGSRKVDDGGKRDMDAMFPPAMQ